VSWDWDFGDGQRSNQQNPQHTYENPGTYTVTLTVSANDGVSSAVCENCIRVTEATTGTNTTANANGNSGEMGEPVSTATGELYFSTTDLFLGGPFPGLFFERYYASRLTDDFGSAGTLGNNWIHNFDLSLSVSGTEARIVYFRGKIIEFVKTGSAWTLKNSEPTIFQLIESGTGYQLMDPSRDLICTFDQTGKLTLLENRNNKSLGLTYTGDLLSQVTDGFGRTLSFFYTSGKLTQVQDQSGRSISFSYTGDNLTSYTDAMGNTTEYSYTFSGGLVGLLTSSRLPKGNTPYTQTYDSQGRVGTQSDSGGNRTTLSFDTPSSGITRVTDPLGYVIEHTHQGQKNLIAQKDVAGESTSISYDANYRRNRLVDRLGDETSITYHESSGKIATYTDALGNTTRFSYTQQDQDGLRFYNLTRVNYPDGTFITMTYNSAGNMLTRVDQGGNTWSYTYNGSGQVLTATNPRGGVISFTYNSDATLATMKDHFNNTMSFTYDDKKRPIRITYPDGTLRSFTYDNNGNLLTVTEERGKVTTYSYDANGNLATITDPLGHALSAAYDGNDRINSTVDQLNKTSTFTYDQLERLKTMKNPSNETITFGYNSHGWLTSMTDPGGKTTTRTYDKEGVVSSFTDPLSNTWNYTTDKLGRISRSTSPLGYSQTYTYNSMGRTTSYINPLSQTTTYSYDSRGLLTRWALSGGISASYARDSLGRITGITDPNGNIWDRSYDEMGRLTSETDPLSNSISYGYDSRSRLATVTYPESFLQITYDETGNIIRKLYSDGTDLTYTYDDNGRLLTANGLSLGYDARGDITSCNGLTITRDDVGRISTISFTEGKAVSYSYNNRGLVSRVSDWVGGTTNLTYDDAGRLIFLSRPNGITTTYTYDRDGRFTGISEQGASSLSSITLTRNGLGNITLATRDIPLMPDLTASAQTFSYNAGGQVSGYSYDKMGRLTADGIRTYTWDLASRLSSYAESGSTTTFTYDGLGMKVSKTSGEITQEYIWNRAFTLPSISIVRQGGSDLRYYIHLPGGVLLHSIEATDNTRRFYHYDEMGTTLFLTDDSGVLTDSYGITPYGLVTVSTGNTDNPFTFTGAYGVMEEGNTGLYYMRARYYDSISGRFISPDSVKSIYPKQINPYQYALRNPLRYVDPSGLRDNDDVPNDKGEDEIGKALEILLAPEEPPPFDPIIPPPIINQPLTGDSCCPPFVGWDTPPAPPSQTSPFPLYVYWHNVYWDIPGAVSPWVRWQSFLSLRDRHYYPVIIPFRQDTPGTLLKDHKWFYSTRRLYTRGALPSQSSRESATKKLKR
jgi:RHS repeat-associated protein